jgi:hypothetical protein
VELVAGFALLLAAFLLIANAVTGAGFGTIVKGQAQAKTLGGTPLKQVPGA